MSYGKFIRPLAFVVCFSFCVSLCFGLASPVMAADDEYMLYNGVELPNIDTVWTNKTKYPCASIFDDNGTKVLLTYATASYYVSGTGLYYRPPVVMYILRGDVWSKYSSQDSDNVGMNYICPWPLVWTSVNIYDASGNLYFESSVPQPVGGSVIVDSVNLSVSSPAPYYPGSDVQLNGQVIGTGIEPGTPESTLYWYIHGNTSEDTYFVSESDSGATLHIGNDETSTSLEIEAISTYDATKSATLELTVTYPLEGVQIIPSGVQQFVQSDKQRTIQYQLLLPNGDPYDYQLIEWVAKPTPGHENYFTINDTGLLTIAPDAPVGSGCTIQFAYQSDTSALSPVGASVQIISQLDGVIDGITPTPEQSDKADQMEDAIGDAAGKLENNNSSLGDLTPTRPQVNTDLQLDQENLLAVSPLVTNIWSINGLGRMISIVLVVATVAYVFFGKRDG